ncbi:MAG: hypothetical protein JW384_01346 [Nitrosomonadaceae bacterium]|nr:hypothetical protein [Nitrosomonadaceae bacterium]
MRMIPATPYNTKSKAERKVFDCLRTMLNGGNSSLIAFHSLNLSQHERKRFGEIDFLICGSEGLFVLEVKGGGVSCTGGRWTFTDRDGVEHRGKESPFKQAETALHGLLRRLRIEFPSEIVNQFVIGYGVVFTDCEWPRAGAEWDPAVLADAVGFRGFDQWISTLFEYWKSKAFGASRTELASLEAVEAVQKFLRPDFEAIVPIGLQTQNVTESSIRLTEDQLSWVDVVEANPRSLCVGGAGTGKTFLAAELARRWTSDGSKVLFACSSPWLKSWLDVRLNLRGLVVSTFDGLDVAMQRSRISKFDALIVDEAQDLMQMGLLDRLDACLENGFSGGRWALFADFQNQSGLIFPTESSALQRIEGYQPTRVPLRTNCRNTLEILETIKFRLGADMGVRGSGSGPAVKEIRVKSKEAAAKALAHELGELVNGGLTLSQITVLSPLTYGDSAVGLLPEKWLQSVEQLDSYAIRTFPPGRISFAQIAAFKGLENDAIIVIDLPPSKSSESRTLHYVGMSRAKVCLSVISSDELVE